MPDSLILSEDRLWLTKSFESESLCNIELNRTIEAFSLSKSTSFFDVPAIKFVKDKSIEIAYYPDSVTYADLLVNDFEKAKELIPKIVRTILFLQGNLKHKFKSHLECEQLNTKGEKSFVHGDFTVHNLLIEDKDIILIDWSSSRWIPQQFNYASIHWDFIWFIQGIFLISSSNKFQRKKKNKIARILVDNYVSGKKSGELLEIAKYAIIVENYFFQNIFKKNSRWFRILKHRQKWVNCETFWKEIINEFT